MKSIYFATTNQGKIASAQRELLRHDFDVIQVETKIVEPEETNDSKIIVRTKLESALEKVPGPVICEDGGLFIRALDWKPGVRTHGYFETENELGLTGAQKLLQELRYTTDRYAYFFNVLGFIEKGWKEPAYFEHKVEGTIIHSIRGSDGRRNWSPAFLIFVPQGYGKTMAEMTNEEYNAFSERVSNFRKLAGYLVRKSPKT